MKRERPSLFAALLVSLLVNVLLRSQTAYWPRAGLFSAALVCAPLLAGSWLRCLPVSWRLAADPVYQACCLALLLVVHIGTGAAAALAAGGPALSRCGHS